MEREQKEGSEDTMTLTETVHGIVCEVCKKCFSGPVPAEQHLQSTVHLRKVQQQTQLSTNPLWCQVCSLQCNSSQQYATHKDSPRHQHMVKQNYIIRQKHVLTAAQTLCRERQSNTRETGTNLSPFLTASREGQRTDETEAVLNFSLLNICAPEDSPPNLSPSSSPGFSSPELAFPVDAATKMNIPTDVPPGGLNFDGSRGHCYVCGIELTSLQHKNQHVEGRQHKKKALMFFRNVGGSGGPLGGSGGTVGVAGPDSGIMMCSICNVPLSGQLNVEQHFSSPKHRARKTQLDRQAAMASDSTFMQPGAMPRAPPNPSALPQPLGAFPELLEANSIPGSFPGRLQSNIPAASRQQPGMEGLQPTGVMPPSPESAAMRFEWVKGKGICHMCDQQFQTHEECSHHLISPEHKQREEDISKPGCTVCRVQYSGPASAVQHLNSEIHKQRVDFLQRPPGPFSSAPQPLPDELPVLSEYKNQLSLTSSQLSHRLSNVLHLDETIKKVAVGGERIPFPAAAFKEMNGASSQPMSFHPVGGIQGTADQKRLNALDEDSTSHVPLTHLNILPSMSVYDNSSVTQQKQQQQQQKQQSPPPEYYFNGLRGFCYVCNIELTSKPHAESHLAGAKHNKAVSRWKLSSFTGPSQAENPAHREIQGTQSTAGNESQEAPPTGHDQATKQKLSYQFDGNRGRCFACKIELSSEAHAKQHLLGKKHQVAAERWVQEGEGGTTYPLYCDVCYKPFTGQESAAQHFSSDKHKKKVALAEGASQGKKDPETGALIIQRDGQTWYMCEVCKVPLNTPEQFRLHVNSPRHNAEVEKAKQQEHSNRSSPIDAPNFQAPSQTPTYQPSAVSSAGEVIGNYSTSADPSDYQHLVKKSSVMVTADPNVPPPPSSQMGTQQLIKTEPGLLPPALSRSETAGQTSWPQHQDSAAVGRESAFTGYSANGFIRGRGRGGYAHMQLPDRSASSVSPGRVPASSSQNYQHAGGNIGNPISVHDSSLSTMNARGQSYGRSSSGHRLSSEAISDMGFAVRQTSHGSSGAGGRRPVTQVLRADGNYEYDNDDNDQKSLPTTSTSTEYQDRHRETQPCSDASLTNTESSLIEGGDVLSMTASEKKKMTSAASTVSNNDASIYSDTGSVTAARRLPLVKEMTPEPQQSLPEPNPFKGFRYSCRLCMQPMNTKEDYDRHMKGLKHQMKAATVCAPDKSGEELKKVENEKESFNEAYHCCKTMPRTYQVDLMCKAMASDSTVVYLPTGTGKTLTAMMTLSRMLTLNPTRPVLFLVDKVLLVLQQARYIIIELGEKQMFLRPHLTDESGKLVERKLKVAVLCGGLSVRDGTPLWKHDVIVTTAAFCQNLLQDEVLRWANFSLVVFDEAHHCTKNHPYNKLLSEHHIKLAPKQRPKVLGLTASPAGRRTKEETLVMLKDLLRNLGGATLAIIESPLAKEQLDAFSSSARLVPVCVPMTEAEMGFHEKLLSYFIRAYVELMRCSNLQQIHPARALQNLMFVKPPKPEDVKKFAQQLMNEPDELSEMVQLAQTAKIKSNTVSPNKFDNIRMHVMTVGMTLLNSEDGIDFVLDDLERLFNPYQNTYFQELVDMGLPCKEIATYVKTLCDSARLRAQEESEKGVEVESGGGGASPSSMSIFQELLGTLANSEYMNWESSDSMALVLVRERKVAHKFKDHLKRTSFVRERSMKVAVVVGHGAGGGEGEGMNLRKQDKVLQGIKLHRYNIVVATSVAEEGVDIPECQLVVSLNPPTTVKALVQMRGRARKKDSYFVVLCSSQREKEKLEDLQRQEQNMKWAAAQLTQENAMLGL